MRIGLSVRTGYGDGDPRVTARWIVERVIAARDARLDSLFVGDHHATPVPYYQNVPMLGRLLAEWDDRTAGALFLLPLWHPVLLAEQVATLASLATGRFVVIVALGAGRSQFAAMGADVQDRVRVFESSLATLRRLLAGDAIDGVLTRPTPPEPVDIWIASSAPPAIDRAARLGDGWLANADLTPAGAREQVAQYVEACARHGRAPGVIGIRRDVHVGRDDADARRVADPVVARGYRGFDPAALTIGGPESVAAQFRDYFAMGYTDILIRHLADDQSDVLASFDRLAEVRASLV
jgi:alkanesulfonate monooxygenase SsuD/methylene tetrahydromethanopterin reductase-like flavin-dependent oxidoreductase (luciferase family)